MLNVDTIYQIMLLLLYSFDVVIDGSFVNKDFIFKGYTWGNLTPLK